MLCSESSQEGTEPLNPAAGLVAEGENFANLKTKTGEAKP
jgi:hypothetical protein